ncbi:MAG: 5-methyltetrahydropteroyltriglutamate--homocysteine methyltransferase [Pseudonocardiales bacterium]|nr:5-methyltetrahydropteroyltriglutamate--homocysteine methyltransferase [Pseudonocardiales bacterium]
MSGLSTLPTLPTLPTSVVGSYPVPEWMERLKTDYYRGRMSQAQVDDLHEMAIKAALRDQELAGIDIVSDGELRRDNDIDYFLARMPGVEIAERAKDFYFDYYRARLTAPLAPSRDAPIGLADDFAFTASQCTGPIKFSFTGPFSLAHRVRNEAYPEQRELVLAMARVLNAEARALADRGAVLLQIDEPFLAGYPDQVATAVEAINVVTEGVDVGWALHVCYGNRYARPLWEGHYDFLFPAVLDAHVDQLVLEFARKGYQDLPVVAKFGWDRGIGLGVIDVKSAEVETPELIAARIRSALELVPAERLTINPDCGLRNVSGAVARAKLAAMVLGTRTVRAELAAREPVAGPPLPVPKTPKRPDPADTAAVSASQPADRTTVSQGV